MPYIALKVVKFDRSYAIGEVIPEAVIASEMAEKLVRCNVIQKQAPEAVTTSEMAKAPVKQKQSKKVDSVENI